MFSCLVIDEGEPFLRGSRINLSRDEILLGRRSETVVPDIDFLNFLVSRRHCVIRHEETGMTITDLGSKHGTAVNGQVLLPNAPHLLQDGDSVVLAKGAVTFRYVASNAWDETMELGRLTLLRTSSALTLDEARRQCIVDGKAIPTSLKEWEFLWILYKHTGKLVSYDEIKCAVWDERARRPGESVPDVGLDEINTLIYRLRRKLGNRADVIRTVRGQGCMLDMTVASSNNP